MKKETGGRPNRAAKPNIVRLLLAGGVSLGLLIILSVFADFYLDLNDDMLIEHLLSGGYTGTPEIRNIQNLFPFSLFVSTLYRLISVNWFGIVLLGLLWLCLTALLTRTMKIAGENVTGKAALILRIAATVFVLWFWCAVLLYHLVFVQYTVVVGVMGGTAAFLILTCEDASSARAFWKNNLLPFVLVTAGFIVRSEMMLFMLPFVGLAALFRVTILCEGATWKHFDWKRWFASLFGALGILLVLLGVCFAIDAAAYQPADWKEFRNLFDARTDLYDFQAVPSYEDNRDFYNKIGLNASEVTLLQNYNYALDDQMDSQVMRQVVDYAAQLRVATKSPKARIREALWVYVHQKLTGNEEMPWNMVSFVLYGLVLISAVFTFLSAVLDHSGSRKAFLEALHLVLAEALLFGARTFLWIYLLYSERPVDRLTHSMYFAEGLILLVLLFYRRRLDITVPLKLLFTLAVLCVGIVLQTRMVTLETKAREVKNLPYTAFKEFCNAHPDSFFLTDVYSTVDFSEKMFADPQTALNWDLAGGWAAKSPAQVRKLAAYGITNPADDLRTSDQVFFAARSDYEIGWLGTFYNTLGDEVIITQVDTIDDYWTIYSVDAWADTVSGETN